MDIVHVIELLLYEVSTALYLPVIAGCALLVTYTPMQLGMSLYEAWQRRSNRFLERERSAASGTAAAESSAGSRAASRSVERLLQTEELKLVAQP